MKRIICIPDLQIPLNDKRATANFLEFLRSYKPDIVASVGDEVDFPQISRWTRGMEGEYKGDLQQHVDAGVAFFEALRQVYQGPLHITRSNHMDRPLNYVRKYAPGLMGLKALTIPSLLEFERFEVQYHEKPYELAPRWLLMHGDEGSLNKVPGGTAMGLARRTGYSVVSGHTHRAGIQHDHDVVNGRVVREMWGMEVGNLMARSQASYLKAGIDTWQQAFGILYVDGRKVTPSLVFIKPDGSFIVEGVKHG